MKPNFSRREFVKKSMWGAATTLSLPGFLQNTLFNLDARAATLPSAGSDGPILVVVELSGGNDSLNTVAPYTNSIYTEARPTIALRDTHGIYDIGQGASMAGGNEALALNPALSGMHSSWQEGELAIINGVGYPNPNLSHFTSFDFWHSAEPNSPTVDGWVGRYFNSECNGCEATQAIEIAGRKTSAFKTTNGISPSVSFRNPDTYGWRDLENRAIDTPQEELYRKLIGLDHLTDDGISIAEGLSYVQRAAHNAMISVRTVQEANEAGATLQSENWSNTRLSVGLQRIARLIKGGMNTSIYYAHQSGYDTHGGQTNGSPTGGRHYDLLNDYDNSLSAFAEEMKLAGLWDRVVILTFSEFGRKVVENGSGGTDHGAAESVFVMGGQVNGGQFYGAYPDLAEEARVKRHSLDYNVDFRTIYRTLLQNWMGVPASSMGEIFPSQPANFDPISFL